MSLHLLDLLSAVKLLTSSIAEIAAASIGEESPVKAVHQAEVDRIGLEAAPPLEAFEEKPRSANEEDLTPAKEELASAEDEEAMAGEKLATSAGTEDKEEEHHATEEPVAEDQVLSPDDEEKILSSEASPEDAASSEEALPVEELTEDPTFGEQTMPEEITSTEAAADTAQLAAASAGPDLEAVLEPELPAEAPVQEAECCQTCHSAPSTGEEELRPPADAPAEDLEGNKEESSSLVEEQSKNCR